MEHSVSLRRTEGFEAARDFVATRKGKMEMDAIIASVAEMEAAEMQSLQGQKDAATDSARRTVFVVIGGGVTTIADELYFDDFTPGNGFVATVGVSEAQLAGNASDAAGSDPAAPQQVNEQEKQDIMNLFRGH